MTLAEKLFSEGCLYSSGWNFGPNDSDNISVMDIVNLIEEHWPDDVSWEIHKDCVKHEANLLKLNCSKAKSDLGWGPIWSASEAINKTIMWHFALNSKKNMQEFSLSQINEYEQGLKKLMNNNSKFEYFILTLNEEKNIRDCIESIKNLGIININVLDGGSTDKTEEICNELNVNFLSFPGSSLSFRRGYAIDESKCKYVVFVDADQRLLKYDFDLEQKIDSYFEEDALLGGVVFSKITQENSNYWERGFGLRHKMVAGDGQFVKVIGTPCVFQADYGKKVGFNRDLEGSCDDTVFCDRLIHEGYRLKSMPENAIEIVRSSFNDTVKKAFWYGNGDSEYIKLYKKTRYRHLFHVLIRMPLIHPLQVIFKDIFWCHFL